MKFTNKKNVFCCKTLPGLRAVIWLQKLKYFCLPVKSYVPSLCATLDLFKYSYDTAGWLTYSYNTSCICMTCTISLDGMDGFVQKYKLIGHRPNECHEDCSWSLPWPGIYWNGGFYYCDDIWWLFLLTSHDRFQIPWNRQMELERWRPSRYLPWNYKLNCLSLIIIITLVWLITIYNMRDWVSCNPSFAMT